MKVKLQSWVFIVSFFVLSGCGWKEIEITNPTIEQSFDIKANRVEFSYDLQGSGMAQLEIRSPKYEEGSVPDNSESKSFFGLGTPYRFQNELGTGQPGQGEIEVTRSSWSLFPPQFQSPAQDFQVIYKPGDVTGGTVKIRYK